MINRPIPKSEEGAPPTTASSNQSGSNDFVKKLFQMLQEDSYKDVVRWTTNGDSFVVLNTNEFTKEILPRHFKHSNFASFVRQLNKYDFHKVKIPNEEKQNYQYGEDAWEFKHPDFRINDRESLENIKRKGPSSKKNSNISSNSDMNMFNSSQGLAQLQRLRDEIDTLKSENKLLHQDINILQTKYKTLIEGIVALKTTDERYYRSMGILINCLVQAGIKLPPLDIPNPSLISLQRSPINQSPLNTVPQQPPHSTSLAHLSPTIPSPNSNSNPQALQGGLHPPGFDQSFIPQQSLQPPLQPIQAHTRPTPPNDTLASKPQSPQQITNSTAGSPVVATSQTGAKEPQRTSTSGPSLDVISATNIPKPKFHVLLVEDDNVCIQLCRKFLVKYGCQVTVVTDGLNAISNVENTKYDLVLMDIVMPNLDGATATSVIRSFDTKTPIIAMTGNIEDNDLVTYLQNGMSDILAKPFTKDDLYSILSKHLLTNELKSDNQNLQGSPQQNIILPHEQHPPPQQAQPHPNTNGNEPLMKKQRLQ